MRALKIAGAVVAAIILVVAVLLVIGIPSGFLTAAIQDNVEKQSGYRLKIAGATKISLWPKLNMSLSDLTLQDPKDRDTSRRVTIGKIEADMTLSSIWSGRPHISELIITKPVVYRQLLRERTLDPPLRGTNTASGSDSIIIDRVRIVDGSMIASNQRDRVEHRVEGINANATIGNDRSVKVSGTARSEGSPVKFDATATLMAEHQPIPVELSLEAPGMLSAPLSARAEVRVNGSIATINNLSGMLGGGAFNGWASVDLASKPLVKVDLDFQRLDMTPTKTTTTTTTQASQAWSEAPIDLASLNYIDLQARISAGTLDMGGAQFSPASIDATIAAGVMKVALSNLGAYGGQASGEVIVDASSSTPTFAIHADIVGVRALPLLQSAANFDKIDGKMQAKIGLRSSGASQHAIMANMAGTAFVVFQDGQLRGLNIAQMIRSLTASTLNGWQEQQEQATDLSQFSASFKADHGQAVTTDLNLVGPLVRITGAGTLDLGTQMMGFRVEPKLVMTTQGQNRTSDPVGFGIPVMIEGPWSSPRIYPEMQGMLDNPDGAYAKLREMGKGLFGPNGGGLGSMLGGLSALTGKQQGGNDSNNSGSGNNANNPLGGMMGGNIGQAIGDMFQKGFSNQNRSIPTRRLGSHGETQPETQAEAPPTPPEQVPAPPSPQAQNEPGVQDSQPMKDVMRQLFNR
jgi:AsmA protein